MFVTREFATIKRLEHWHRVEAVLFDEPEPHNLRQWVNLPAVRE